MMRVRVNSPRVVIVDPHDGLSCNGQHAVVVNGIPIPAPLEEECGRLMQAGLTWQGSALLSVRGAKEFLEALRTAVGIAEQMEERGGYVVADEAGPLPIGPSDDCLEEEGA